VASLLSHSFHVPFTLVSNANRSGTRKSIAPSTCFLKAISSAVACSTSLELPPSSTLIRASK